MHNVLHLIKAISFVSLILYSNSLCRAEEINPEQLTLQKIINTKTIALGYLDNEFPFSWLSGNTPTGYSIEICKHIVDTLKNKLQLKNLKTEWVKANSASQLILINNHKLDLMCAPTFYIKKSQHTGELSLPIYFSSTRYITRKDERDYDLKELSGHSVFVKSGTIYVEQLKHMDTPGSLNINIQLGIDYGIAFNKLKNGECSVLISSTVLLKGMIAQASTPGDYKLSHITLSPPIPAGLLIPSHDKAFKEFIDSTLLSLVTSSKFAVLYNKWFQSPIPPKGINLNIPMSDTLKALATVKNNFNYEKYN